MPLRDDRAPVWAIWLLIAFAAAQPLVWTLAGGAAPPPLLLIPLLIVWVSLLALAALATRRVGWLWRTLTQSRLDHRSTLSENAQLQTQNAMLEIVARSGDVPQAFQELGSRIAQLVPCDRIGLALLPEEGDEFQTFTIREESDRATARGARPDVVFKVDRTLIGAVIQSREPMILGDLEEAAPDYLDANVVVAAGFKSALILPLIARERAVGTLNVVSRRAGAFERTHLEPLQPIAELLAVAWIAQQAQLTAGKYQTMETMSELTLAIASDINSALQAIVGGCDLLARSNRDPAVRRDLDTIVQQAKRIAELLDRMRAAAADRLREASARRKSS